MARRHVATLLLASLAVSAIAILHAQGSGIPADLYSQLRWRYIGPEGNRVSAIAGVPGDPLVDYAGAPPAASSRPLTAASTGSRSSTVRRSHRSATSPSHRPIRTSSGRAPARRAFAATSRSAKASSSRTDAGKTWTRMGLEKTGRIGESSSIRTNPDIVLACALGHAYGPQPERGVFRTTDGGKTWQRTLFVDENTGCSDIDDGSRATRAICSRACGSSRSTRGGAKAAARQRPVHVDGRRRDVDSG